MTPSNVATLEQPRLPSLPSGGAVRAIVPQDFDGAWRIANAVVKAGMAPRGLDTPEKAMVAIMHGLEVGMTPMTALQSIAVINSRATIWGDGALGLVQASGKMESHKEWFEGAGDTRRAFCIVKRKGDPEPKQGEFGVSDAKTAKLWGKSGPWTEYSDRMLKMRARAFALRDGFSDVLKGLGIAEEVQDTPPAIVVAPPPPPAAQIAAPAESEPLTIDADAVLDVEAFMAGLFMDLEAATDADTVQEAWDAADVEVKLSGMDDRLAEAFTMKQQRLEALAA